MKTLALVVVVGCASAEPAAEPVRPVSPLYGPMFSPVNDAVPALDQAFRTLETALRPHDCIGCHAVDDVDRRSGRTLATKAFQLRHEIVLVLDANVMPPASDGPAGIADDRERRHLLELAKAFAAAGDLAVARDGVISAP